MIETWHGFRLISLSFWIGFFTGFLFFVLLRYLFPKFKQAIPRVLMKYNQLKTRSTETIEKQYREELILFTQKKHLASAFFPLDEIIVEPKFFFSPYRRSDEEEIFGNLADKIIPYMPDWPELAAYFQADTLTAKQILDSETNIAILGHPGTGKTVALAYFTSLIARRDERAGKLSRHLPVFIHVADLIAGGKPESRPFEIIVNLVRLQFPQINSLHLSKLILNHFRSGNVVLLLDGYDELSSSKQLLATKFIKTVLEEYPETLIIAAADVLDFSGLKELHPIPITISPWNTHQRRDFLLKWIKNWQKVTTPIEKNLLSGDNQYLLTSWLANDTPFVTPLETILKVWAVTAGDLISPSPLECMDLFIKRYLIGNEQILDKYEELAVRMISNLSFSCDIRKIEEKINMGNVLTIEASRKTKLSISSQPGNRSSSKSSSSGLLIFYPMGSIAFVHPMITSFLAAKTLSQTPIMHYFESQPDWMGKRLTMGFINALRIKSPETFDIPQEDPLSRSLLSVSRWLHYLPNNSNLQNKLLKILAQKIQQPDLTRNLRFKFLAALLCSHDPGLNVLFRSMVKSAHPGIRMAGILGLGFLNDHSSIPLIEEILATSSLDEAGAACLALSTLGSQRALELLGTILLSGEEKIKIFAALALSYNHPDGQEMLKEGSRMKDFLIRRAVVFGLARISEPWSKEIIERLAMEDEQWLVRDIATQALTFLNNLKPAPPSLPPELSEAAWLIEFASSKGLGVSPGKPAMQMLYTVLREGSQSQKIAALEYLRLNGEDESLGEIIKCMDSADDFIREAAFDALWHNLAMGLKYPLQI